MSRHGARRRPPPDDRGPRPLSESLDDALRTLGPPRSGVSGDVAASRPASAGTWGAVFARWEEIVGTALAQHVRPIRVDGAVLVVAVDRPPWATQVRALAPQILARVAELVHDPPGRLEVLVRPRPPS